MKFSCKGGGEKESKEYAENRTHRLVDPVGHLPDDGLQLYHGHVGGLIVGVRRVVTPQEACGETTPT